MNITEKEEQLFSRWEKSRIGFVRDGIVSEEDYKNSHPKVAFILKDVNDEDGGGWDLREFLRKGAQEQTWDNVARWVYGIRDMKNRNTMPEWQSFPKSSQERDSFRKEALKSICAMNLKKSPGGHTAVGKVIRNVAREDKENIQTQYGFYDPDITICCGVGDLFFDLTDNEGKKWRETTRGIRWYEREPGKCVISFSHPEARVSDPLLVYGLLDAVREIYKFDRL